MSEYFCPHCKKPIYDNEALLCHFCGESLGRPVGFLGKMRHSYKMIVGIIVVLVALAFLLSIF